MSLNFKGEFNLLHLQSKHLTLSLVAPRPKVFKLKIWLSQSQILRVTNSAVPHITFVRVETPENTGVIKLGEYEIPCYVLTDETRVLSQREVVKLISGGRESGNLNRYLNSQALQPYLPEKFRSEAERNPLIFKAGPLTVHAIKASDVVDICNAYLKARLNGALQLNQSKIAEQAEMFISACAKTGIDAIVDEATGFQYFRRASDLQAKFQAYLQDEYREWTLTFPRQFFMQLYKLEGIARPLGMQPYPKRFGKYVMHFIYDTLDPDIADRLRETNPNPGGHKHHHQLFNDFGYINLQQHVMSILGIMKASINLERFKENIAIAFPNTRTQRAARMLNQKKLASKDEGISGTKQMGLFDYIETVNTPSKEEKIIEGEMQLSSFNKNLLKALNFNPKEDKSK